MSIDWGNKVITVNKSDSFMTQQSASQYVMDVNGFRLALKDKEDDPEGMTFPDTHRHVGETIISGVTYARFVEIINGYTVTFEDGQYTVVTTGANHNISDVMNQNQVSLVTNNSAGLVVTGGGGGNDSIAIGPHIRLSL